MNANVVRPVPRDDQVVQVALFPDRLAHYRRAVFAALSRDLASESGRLVIFAAGSRSMKTIPSADEFSSPDGLGFERVEIGEFTLRGLVFWQTRPVLVAAGSRYGVIVLWGEAHRLSSWLAIIIGRLRGKRVILWGHGIYGRESRLKRFLRTRMHRMASHSLLYGSRARDLLAEAGIGLDRMTVVHNALDHDAIREARARVEADAAASRPEAGNGPRRAVILYVGRLVANKRLDVLVDGLAHCLEADRAGLELRLVGGGPERALLEARIERLGIGEFVSFLGELYDEESLAREFCAADVVVSPGNVGLLAVHAHAYGKPLITHGDMDWQMPEVDIIEPGVTGDFFRRDDAEDLARVIRRWLGTHEPGACRAACIARVEADFTPDQVAARASAAILAR